MNSYWRRNDMKQRLEMTASFDGPRTRCLGFHPLTKRHVPTKGDFITAFHRRSYYTTERD